MIEGGEQKPVPLSMIMNAGNKKLILNLQEMTNEQKIAAINSISFE